MSSTPLRQSWPEPIGEVVDTALGAVHRDDPAHPRTGGPAGNARLTAWAGLLLLVLFVVECVTLLGLRQMITVHILVGTVLVPLVLLKTGTTGWRIVRYYTHDRLYLAAGPPPLLIRLLGPLVVLTGLAVLGTGLALVPLGDSSFNALFTAAGQRIDPLTLHKAAFVAWLVVTGAHTLVRLVPATMLVAGRTSRSAVDGGRSRMAVLAVTLVVGAVAAVLVLQASDNWTRGQVFGRHDVREGGVDSG
jgi:hypothetical protein